MVLIFKFLQICFIKYICLSGNSRSNTRYRCLSKDRIKADIPFAGVYYTKTSRSISGTGSRGFADQI
ncbi:hypothetical protein DN748_04030 [Sinomicrobium soli]|nr:hypothetical protein DN748_04030 [Sinomicrobium sp. N-1-3-6]